MAEDVEGKNKDGNVRVQLEILVPPSSLKSIVGAANVQLVPEAGSPSSSAERPSISASTVSLPPQLLDSEASQPQQPSPPPPVSLPNNSEHMPSTARSDTSGSPAREVGTLCPPPPSPPPLPPEGESDITIPVPPPPLPAPQPPMASNNAMPVPPGLPPSPPPPPSISMENGSVSLPPPPVPMGNGNVPPPPPSSIASSDGVGPAPPPPGKHGKGGGPKYGILIWFNDVRVYNKDDVRFVLMRGVIELFLIGGIYILREMKGVEDEVG